jgi:predicted Zn-dependent peptidase
MHLLQTVEDLTADDVRDAAQLVFNPGNSFAAYVTRPMAA